MHKKARSIIKQKLYNIATVLSISSSTAVAFLLLFYTYFWYQASNKRLYKHKLSTKQTGNVYFLFMENTKGLKHPKASLQVISLVHKSPLAFCCRVCGEFTHFISSLCFLQFYEGLRFMIKSQLESVP